MSGCPHGNRGDERCLACDPFDDNEVDERMSAIEARIGDLEEQLATLEDKAPKA